MALVVYSDRALDDFERPVDFLLESSAPSAASVAALVADAISVLERHPRIGRPAEQGLYELVISHGKTGYAALYRYLEAADIVLVLAIRHQREAGHP